MKHILTLAAIPMLLMGWTSCTTPLEPLPNPHTINKNVPEYKNPFSPTCYAHFVARKDYVDTYEVYKDASLVDRTPKGSQSINICLNNQRGQYIVDGLVAMDFPISTGVKSYPTKTGNYRVLNKEESHASNLFGKMYNAEGKCIDYNANASDPIPEGGRFEGSSMPFWQRLTWEGLGLHVGKVRRKPLSHGCIRLQRDVAKTLYNHTNVGTRVTINDAPMPVVEAQKVRAED